METSCEIVIKVRISAKESEPLRLLCDLPWTNMGVSRRDLIGGRAVACLGPLPRRQSIKYGELAGLFLAEDLTIPDELIRDFEPRK